RVSLPGRFAGQQTYTNESQASTMCNNNAPVHFHAVLLRRSIEMDPIVRRSTIGIASGLICSVPLVETLHGLLFGVALGVAIGTLYAIAVRPTPFAYAESIFTAGALAIPLWTVLSVIVFPTLARVGPQCNSQGIQSFFPQFVGWVLYGAALGLVAQALS